MSNSIIPVQKRLQEQFGFQVNEVCSPVLKKIIYERSLQTRYHSVEDYCQNILITASSPEWYIIIDQLTIKETHFFRNHDQFVFMKERIIPEYERTRWRWPSQSFSAGKPVLRILSAGCATGEEPYSVAMVLMDHLSGYSSWTIILDAFDISTTAIHHARLGRYEATDRMRQSVIRYQPEYLKRFFDDEDPYYTVKDEVRKQVCFRTGNIMNYLKISPTTLPKYDLVFCRNVLIYYAIEDQRNAVHWLSQSLNDGGYLFLGESEGLFPHPHDLEIITSHRGLIYRKKPIDN